MTFRRATILCLPQIVRLAPIRVFAADVVFGSRSETDENPWDVDDTMQYAWMLGITQER